LVALRRLPPLVNTDADVSLARSGRSRSNSSSLNQNSLKSTLSLPKSMDHIRAAKKILFMGPDPKQPLPRRCTSCNDGILISPVDNAALGFIE